MARKAILTDGTRTVDLIDISTIIPQRGAFGKARYAPHQYDSARVVDDMLFVETWKLNVYGTSHDNLATQTALFKALLRDAWRYHKADFDTPVYLEVRTDDETNTRFATVWLCPEITDPDFFTHPFALDNVIENYGVNIARFAWESLPQGIRGNRILQTATIGPDYSPAATDYDVDLTAEDGQLPHTMTGGLIGRPGAFGRAVQVAEATINHVLNPSAEAAGNFAAVGGAATQSINTAMFGTNSYRVVTRAVANDGMTLTLNALANALHYVTIRSHSTTVLTDWEWSLDGATWNAMVTIGIEDSWIVYGFQFPAVEANGSVLLTLRHTPNTIVTVYLDAAQVEQHDYPTCYDDGSLGPGHVWALPAHGSISTRTAHVLRYDVSDCSMKGTLGVRMMPIYEEDEKPVSDYVLTISNGANPNSLSIWKFGGNAFYSITYGGAGVYTARDLDPGDIVRLSYSDIVVTWDLVADEFKVYIDGVQIGATLTGLTTPNAAWDRLYVGASVAGANQWSGWIDDLFLLDGVVLSDTEVALLDASNKKFTGHKATDLYLDFDGPKFNHLANFRDDIALTEVWQFDTVGPWTDVGPDNNEFTWFPAAIAQNDALYWGSTEPFKHIAGFFRTAGALTTTDLVLEYSDGPAFNDYAALVFGTDYTIYSAADLETFCERTGNYTINIRPPADWDTNDPSNAATTPDIYWIRLRENDNSPPVWPTKPIHAGQGTFTPRDNYIEVPSTVLGGDAKAKLLLRNRTPTGGDENEGFANSSRILIGAKENPGTFVMSLNAGADNTDWTINNITDAATVVDTDSPGGSRCHITFADPTMVSRLRLTGANKLADWIGEYRAMLRCQQVGGAVGDVSVRLQVIIGDLDIYAPRFETKTIDLEGVTQGHEQVALSTNEPGGTVKIPWIDTKSSDNFANIDIHFNIFASRVAGSAAVLHVYCLDLLPVKNWAVELDDPLGNTIYGSTTLRGDNCIDIDAGLITDRTSKMINALANPVPVESWTRGGPPPQLNPETQVKMYFVNMHYPAGGTWGTGPLIASLGMHLTAEVWAHNQFYALRGNN